MCVCTCADGSDQPLPALLLLQHLLHSRRLRERDDTHIIHNHPKTRSEHLKHTRAGSWISQSPALGIFTFKLIIRTNVIIRFYYVSYIHTGNVIFFIDLRLCSNIFTISKCTYTFNLCNLFYTLKHTSLLVFKLI